MSGRGPVRPPDVGAMVVARIREAMDFRFFTVEDLAGATDMQPTLVARRLMEPERLMVGELEAIRKACQVPVAFLFAD